MRRTRKDQTAPRIRVGGRYLDEVGTRLHDRHQAGSVAYLRLPAEHHRLVENEDDVVLRLPAITALQLFFDGALTSRREESFELAVGDEIVGRFRVGSLRRVAGHAFETPVLLRLVRIA